MNTLGNFLERAGMSEGVSSSRSHYPQRFTSVRNKRGRHKKIKLTPNLSSKKNSTSGRKTTKRNSWSGDSQTDIKYSAANRMVGRGTLLEISWREQK
ncbi:hypothetical protein CEXT_332851 [Caerostris extrusa]|uniref:Uncharacterized protein n=1 Tax=Caerostris extrusa TaxID=172846 RepID=A0AAV4MA94_CAEEX|nr:hypothetical protein CEXT_332851 [Caerostris extrusa]